MFPARQFPFRILRICHSQSRPRGWTHSVLSRIYVPMLDSPRQLNIDGFQNLLTVHGWVYESGYRMKYYKSLMFPWYQYTVERKLYVDYAVSVSYQIRFWTAPSHYLNQCWNIGNWTLRSIRQWNLNQNWYIFIQENGFENVVWKMAAILSRPQCFKHWILGKRALIMHTKTPMSRHILIHIKSEKRQTDSNIIISRNLPCIILYMYHSNTKMRHA